MTKLHLRVLVLATLTTSCGPGGQSRTIEEEDAAPPVEETPDRPSPMRSDVLPTNAPSAADAAEMRGGENPRDAARPIAEDGSTSGDTASSDATAAPEPTMPPALPGLVLWLDAAKGVTANGTKVSRWGDQSPAKNDALMENAAFQPTAATLGGFPSIHFTGKKDPKNGGGDGGPYLHIKDNASLNWGTGDWLIEVVAAYDNQLDGTHSGAFGTFYGKWADKVEILFTGNWTLTEKTEQAALHIGFGEGGVGMESKRKDFNDGKVRVYGARRAKGTLQLRVNGKLDRSTGNAGTNLDMPGIDVGIGSFSGKSATRCLRGDILLVVAVKGATDDATTQKLEDYLAAHYKAAP